MRKSSSYTEVHFFLYFSFDCCDFILVSFFRHSFEQICPFISVLTSQIWLTTVMGYTGLMIVKRSMWFGREASCRFLRSSSPCCPFWKLQKNDYIDLVRNQVLQIKRLKTKNQLRIALNQRGWQRAWKSDRVSKLIT